MAFTQGQIITASGLNTINASNSFNLSDTRDKHSGEEYYPSASGVYSHRPYGATVASWYVSYGTFGGATIKLQKLISGVWTTLATCYDKAVLFGDTDSGTENSTGPGWYRFYVTQTANVTGTIYYAQTGNQAGDYLAYFDNPASSGNRLPGTLLTTARLNGGRAGTIA